MQVYRRYELTRQGRILKGEWFEAADDKDALEHSRRTAGGHAVEVWQRTRRVGYVEPF